MDRKEDELPVSGAPTVQRVHDELALVFGGTTVRLIETCLFIEVAQCFLFDRHESGGASEREFHDIIVTADCEWRLLRDGSVVVGSNEKGDGRRLRLVKPWIRERSRLLEWWLHHELERGKDSRGVVVRSVHLSDTCEVRFVLENGLELVLGPYRRKSD